MPARAPRPAYNHWRDVEGTPIPLLCRVEQVAVHKEHGALPSRLRKQGQVLGRGSTRLQVRFDGETRLVRLRPHLVRVLETPDHHRAPDTTPLPVSSHPRPAAGP